MTCHLAQVLHVHLNDINTHYTMLNTNSLNNAKQWTWRRLVWCFFFFIYLATSFNRLTITTDEYVLRQSRSLATDKKHTYIKSCSSPLSLFNKTISQSSHKSTTVTKTKKFGRRKGQISWRKPRWLMANAKRNGRGFGDPEVMTTTSANKRPSLHTRQVILYFMRNDDIDRDMAI